jgi:small-conductance mechanosensitive channel
MPLDPLVLIVPVAVFFVVVASVLLGRRILFGGLHKWSKAHDSQLGNLAAETLSGPILLWSLILGLHVSTQVAEIPHRYQRFIEPAIDVLWILAITSAVSRFAGRAVRYYGTPVTGAKSVTSLTQKVVQFIVVAIGIVWLLKDVFNVSLGPILTTLGVGGLAVALALQDTLSNLFAGFYVSISGLVNLGDYLKLSSGEEGYVVDIAWRCTTLRTGSNNLVVIPNNKLATTTYTNFQLPEGRMGLSLTFNLGMDADVDRVMASLQEEVTAATYHISGLLATPAPGVRFNGPTENGLQFLVYFNVGKYDDQAPVLSDLRRVLFKRLRNEGVHFDVPPKAVILQGTSAAGE